MDNVSLNSAINELRQFVGQENAFRAVLLLIFLIIVAYIFSKYLGKIIIKIAQMIAVQSDATSNLERSIQLRQVETYLSIAVAVVRAFVVAIVAYVAFRTLSPAENPSGIAAIGAGTVFIVFAGQTLGMLLRDITAGTMMISEDWFHVGDFVKVEPFMDLSGVVERFTLRSTKIRTLSGEVVWVHNQQMAAVHVTPRGVRTIAVDVFVRDREKGETALEELINTIPVGPLLLAQKLRIRRVERWNNSLWRITIVGQTAPGREWLVEKFFVDAIKAVDEDVENKADRTFIYEPIARYDDPVAEKRFKRAIRAAKND